MTQKLKKGTQIKQKRGPIQQCTKYQKIGPLNRKKSKAGKNTLFGFETNNKSNKKWSPLKIWHKKGQKRKQ